MTDQLPTKWDELLAREAQALATQERPAIGKLSFRGGVMMYQGTPVPNNTLRCVILATAFEHAFYEGAYNSQDPSPPVCFALANTTADGSKPVMAPHRDAPKKVHNECITCPKFAWASDPKGGRGKACKEVRRMFLIGESAIRGTGQDVRRAEAATGSVPVTSVKNWANYVALLSGQHSMPTWAVLTQLTVVPDAKTQFQLKFDPIEPLRQELYPDIYARVQAAQPMLIMPYSPKTATPLREGVKY